MASPTLPSALLPIAVSSTVFMTPQKRIHTHDDLALFRNSPAYTLITSFIVHLNSCISPLDAATNVVSPPEDFTTDSASTVVSPEVAGVTNLVTNLTSLIDSAPPEKGPRRFGNVAFRKWLELAQEYVSRDGGVDAYLPACVLPGKEELLFYLTNSFGSGERLDYGTGHELAFAAFLCGIWVLAGFQPGRDEKALVFKTFDAYFKLIRKLVTTYNLEPAGSHGVWGLDDHAFFPYIFGSAQLTTFRPTNDAQGVERSAKVEEKHLPKPADILKLDVVKRERNRNLYFDAVGFIYDVKTGPFWEHSPILYDISGVQKGWGKINEGMLKMYDVEVLGKLPVVQHFKFGSIFRWFGTPDPSITEEASNAASAPPAGMETARAPWAITAPSSHHPPLGGMETTRALRATGSPSNTTTQPPIITRALWATPPPPPYPTPAGIGCPHPLPPAQPDGADTKAPWATTPTPPQTASPISSQRASLVASTFDSRPPWEASKEKGQEAQEASGVNVCTEARLGPKRTSSPDVALAKKAVAEGERGRSINVGGVRVAETGDLSRRRPSRTG